MKFNSSNKVALITSAINPAISSHSTKSNIRQIQTLTSLQYLYRQQVFDQVILIDGSGCDLSALQFDSKFKRGWLSCYTFNQDKELVDRHGYGYGELLIYDEFIRLFPDFKSNIYKISGRYIVENLNEIVNSTLLLENYFFTYYPRFLEYRNYVHTSLFKISKADLITACSFAKLYIELHSGAPLERAICEWILFSRRHRKWNSVPLPQYEGVSGYTGLTLRKKNFPYNIFSKFYSFSLMGFSI